jgi:hypothetical protein
LRRQNAPHWSALRQLKERTILLNRFRFFGILVPLISALAAAHAQNALVVTATNAAQNQLLIYDSTGQLIHTVSAQGQGGVGGNAGGIEAKGSLEASG